MHFFSDDRYSVSLLQFIFVLIIAVVGANVISQAATRTPNPRSLSSENNYWQQAGTKQPDSKPHSASTTADTAPTSTTPNQDATTTEVAGKEKPSITADAHLIGNLNTGHLLTANNASSSVPIASITKLITAVVAQETINANEQITITDSAAAAYGSSGGLKAGDTLTLGDLYYPLLLSSSNDAARAIAEHTSAGRFLSLLQRKALALSMDKTHFADASGLSERNRSSARDLFVLAQYLHSKHPHLLDITTQTTATLAINGESKTFTNTHPFASHPSFLGGKNGFTDQANHTLMSVFQIEKMPVAVIVLGTDTPRQDTLKLLDWTQQYISE